MTAAFANLGKNEKRGRSNLATTSAGTKRNTGPRTKKTWGGKNSERVPLPSPELAAKRTTLGTVPRARYEP
jgi:hypothetical protein